MRRFKRGSMVLAAMVSCLSIPSVSMALPITTDLDIANRDIGIYGTYATVTVEQIGADTVQFTVDADEVLLGADSYWGIQAFGFNTTLNLTVADFILPTGWHVLFNQQISDFGIFRDDVITSDWRYRVDPLSFTVTNSGIDSENQFFVANGEGYHYVAQIGGFTPNPLRLGSIKVTDLHPVPEPAALLLLGPGLLGFALLRRKRS